MPLFQIITVFLHTQNANTAGLPKHMLEHVILVDESDTILGQMEKMEAHEKALLHRAFSVFLFNEKGETLLQKRAEGKYHSPLLWTNSCCSHPRFGETVLEAAQRRLFDELGIPLECDLSLHSPFHFIYRADFDNGLTEHELDHVVIGRLPPNVSLHLNPEEVDSVRWMAMTEVVADALKNPNHYTAWFKIILDEYVKHLPL